MTSVTIAAPFTEADLATALAPFGRSTGLPAEAYSSPEVLVWEQRHLFASSWLCVGRAIELLPEGASHAATTAGRVPVLLTRGPDGTVAALANTCRHRGHELLADGSTAGGRALVCPYHAWSYDLSGALIAAPGFAEDLDANEHRLVRLPVQEWHGWIFVTALGDAAPFAEHVGALADLVAPYAPERLFLRARHDYDVAANWKVMIENYHECYHCPLIHPELCQVSPPASGRNLDLPGRWIGGPMDLHDGAVTMSLDGTSRGRPIAGVDAQHVYYLGLLPNLLLSLHPDYLMTHRLTPLEPGRTRIECSWFFPDPDVDPAYAVDFWDLTNRQDWAACESVQRGLQSPHYRPGPLAPNEDAVHQFVTAIARGYLQGSLPS